MRACFYSGLSDISDDGRTASTVQRDTCREYQPFLPPVSEQELCESVWPSFRNGTVLI